MTEISRRNLLKLAGATAALAPLLGTAVLAKTSMFGPDEKVYYLSQLQENFFGKAGLKVPSPKDRDREIIYHRRAFSNHIRDITLRDHSNGMKSVMIVDNAYRGVTGWLAPSGMTVMYSFHKVIMIEPDTKRWKVIKDRY